MLTCGGDCQALNAAMRGVVKGLHNNLEHAPKGKKKLGERMRERAEKKSKELNQKRAELEKDTKKKHK